MAQEKTPKAPPKPASNSLTQGTGQINNSILGQFSGGSGGAVGGGQINWNQPVTSAMEEQLTMRLWPAHPAGATPDDPYGLADLFPKMPGATGVPTLESRKASIARMSSSQKESLVQLLIQTDELKPPGSGGVTDSSLSNAVDSLFLHASQAGSPTLTAYLDSKIQGGSSAATNAAAADVSSNIDTIAKDYLIPMSPGDYTKWEAQGADAFRAYAQQTAEGMFPTMAAQINQGYAPSTLLSPYASLAEKTVGATPDTINWMSGPFATALTGSVDPKSGRQVPMTLSQWSQELMSNPVFGYQNTQEGLNAASSLSASLAKIFGVVGNAGLSTSMSGPTPDLAAT